MANKSNQEQNEQLWARGMSQTRSVPEPNAAVSFGSLPTFLCTSVSNQEPTTDTQPGSLDHLMFVIDQALAIVDGNRTSVTNEIVPGETTTESNHEGEEGNGEDNDHFLP
mmetsp:Transcript_29958/g.49736  ORF Transcript_29958/g.49736 Transcript_29958/m.49736 type:complete len:110 (+) Transcript_29958:1777-2106(+)